MVTIDGTTISGATIDGQEVQEITVDGDTVWEAIFKSEDFEGGSFSSSSFEESFTIDEEGGGRVVDDNDTSHFGYSFYTIEGNYSLLQDGINDLGNRRYAYLKYDENNVNKVSWSMKHVETDENGPMPVIEYPSGVYMVGPTEAGDIDRDAYGMAGIYMEEDGDYIVTKCRFNDYSGDTNTHELFREVDYLVDDWTRECHIELNNGDWNFNWNGETYSTTAYDLDGNSIQTSDIVGFFIETGQNTSMLYDEFSVTRI